MGLSEDNTILVEEYVKRYLLSFEALLDSIPDVIKRDELANYLCIGRAEIWPCNDGAVVLFYRNKYNEIKVVIRETQKKSLNEFLKKSAACASYDKYGKRSKKHTNMELSNPLYTTYHFQDLGFFDKNGRIISKPKYDKGAIFGWESKPPKPEEMALKVFKEGVVSRNIVGSRVASLPQNDKNQIIKAKAEQLLLEYSALLNTAKREEELQVFLSKHPEFIYPDYISCYSKFKLGEDFVTDYVLLIHGHHGPEYVFVEIERPDKEIFTRSGQFSASFTQAKDQLLDWDSWLTKNHAYVSSKLNKLYKPHFHLILGRGNELTNEQIEKIQSEFSATTRRFSTYDDLASRFGKIVERLFNFT